MDNLAVRRKSQTDLAGNQGNCLYTSRSLSHWIGLAEGTRPQPTPTEITTTLRRSYLSACNWNTQMIQARK